MRGVRSVRPPGDREPDTTAGGGGGAPHFGRALRLYRDGRLADARAACGAALRRDGRHAPALHLLGLIALRRGDARAALDPLRRAAAAEPDDPTFLSNLGCALAAAGEPEAALGPLERAVRLAPGRAEARVNLANALRQLGRHADAVTLCEEAVASGVRSAVLHNALGVALQQAGRVDEAGVHVRAAAALDPSFAEARVNHAMILLLTGRFEEGWSEYRWRWRARRDPAIRPFPQPHWDGAPAPGRTLLLRAEQGYGDAIQFARYAELAGASGARVLLECHPPLRPLLDTAAGVARAYARGEPLPHFDLQAFLLDLPMVARTTAATIPARVPYLSAEPGRVGRVRGRLRPSRRPLVGLVWAGDRNHPNDRNRSCGLAAMAPLWAVEGVTFVSVQSGPAAEELAGAPVLGADRVGAPADFADTAALLAELDLLVSVDTAAAHLAGALGRPVWLALPHAPDWRWQLGRADSPWYPTATLFRQPAPGDWRAVFTAMAGALRRVARRPGTAGGPA